MKSILIFVVCTSFSLLLAVRGSLAAGEEGSGERRANSPITVEVPKGRTSVSFLNRSQPGNRIGYRFFEHTPLVFGTVPESPRAPAEARAHVDALRRVMLARPGVGVYRKEVLQDGQWIRQSWQFLMAPAADGVDLLWLIETHEEGLPSYYGVQQCFRLSGRTNQAWRREIAETPAFSEFDLWHSQAAAKRTSLTYVLRGGSWEPMPAIDSAVGARTPYGVVIDRKRFAENLPDRVGAYQAKMLAPIDGGLITRVNAKGTWVCGLFWERTSHVTDHHPADCLHAIVDIGDIPARTTRAIRGKIYWFEGTLADLGNHWRKDFASANAD
jgi:hypothetical protein